MNVILAKTGRTAAVETAADALAEAVRQPSAAGFTKGNRDLLALADPECRCTISWTEWESAIARARAVREGFAPGFLLADADIDLLLGVGVPDAARSVLEAARADGAAVLQCFPEDEP